MAVIKQSEMQLHQKFSDFKAEMRGAQEEPVSKVTSHVLPYKYEKKAHEEQAASNDKVQDTVRKAVVQQAKATLQEGTDCWLSSKN